MIMIPWWIALAAFAAGEIFGIVVRSVIIRKDKPKSKYIRQG